MARKRTCDEVNKPSGEEDNNDSRNRVSLETLKGAVDALWKSKDEFTTKAALSDMKNTGKQSIEEAIVPSEQSVWLQVTFKTPPLADKLRPVAVPLKHSLFKEGEDVLFIVTEPQRKMKDHLNVHGSGGVTRIMDIGKLYKRHKTFEAKRELLTQYDHFLVDVRIAPKVPQILGKPFIEAKRLPLPVNTNRHIVNGIKRALASTAYCPRRGSSCSVRVGLGDFSADMIVDNVFEVLNGVMPKIQGGWAGIQALALKTDKSPALPIFSALPGVEIIDKVPGVEGIAIVSEAVKDVAKDTGNMNGVVKDTGDVKVVAKDGDVKDDSLAKERPAKKRRKSKGNEKKKATRVDKVDVTKKSAKATDDDEKEEDVVDGAGIFKSKNIAANEGDAMDSTKRADGNDKGKEVIDGTKSVKSAPPVKEQTKSKKRRNKKTATAVSSAEGKMNPALQETSKMKEAVAPLPNVETAQPVTPNLKSNVNAGGKSKSKGSKLVKHGKKVKTIRPRKGLKFPKNKIAAAAS